MIAESGVLPIPAEWRWPPHAAVFVGGCVKRGIGASFQAAAHSHNYAHDEHFGWICVPDVSAVLNPDASPSYTVLHELAHVLVPNQGHTKRWIRTGRGLGLPPHLLHRESIAMRMVLSPEMGTARANGNRHRRTAAPAVTYTRI